MKTNKQKTRKKIDDLKAQYPYKQGRPPKTDTKACENLEDRKQLKNGKVRTKKQINTIQERIKRINSI